MIDETTPLERVAFAVVDVETTGLNDEDGVIEIACVKLHGFVEIAQFQTLVNPGRPVPPESTAVSGIDSAMVALAPSFRNVVAQLDLILDGCVFVAHNAPFDLRFLSAERKRCGRESHPGPVIDTLRLARNAIALPGYSLAELREHLQLAPRPTHRALADVLATAALLERLVALLYPRPRTLGELLRAQLPIPVPWETLDVACLPAEIALPIRRAHERQESIAIEYHGRSGERRYAIRPIRVERNGPLLYLLAELADRAETRTFRFDRIARIVPPDKPETVLHLGL